MLTDDLERILAATGIESEVFRRRLGASCLESPGLLDGLSGLLPREIDFATRHAGEDRLDATLDRLPVPASWLDWSRRLLSRLSPADGSVLLRAGVAGVPGMPEGVALPFRSACRAWPDGSPGTAGPRGWSLAGAFGPLGAEPSSEPTRSGPPRSGASCSRIWNGPETTLPGLASGCFCMTPTPWPPRCRGRSARWGSRAARGSGPVARRSLSPRTGRASGSWGAGDSRVARRSVRARHALWIDAARARRETHRGLNRARPVPTQHQAATALALLDTWAWMGRQRRDRAEASLAAAEASAAMAGGFAAMTRHRCQQLGRLSQLGRVRVARCASSPAGSGTAFSMWREIPKLHETPCASCGHSCRPASAGGHAWCDVSEAAILEPGGPARRGAALAGWG